jgi:hypothetical protein
MAQDTFLICRNCINWGQPWVLGKKTVICEQKKDIHDTLYTSTHPACKYFIPIVGDLPDYLQRMRLFVQTLTPTQQSYFAWSLSQASLLLKARDSQGQRLALGDQVTFRLGILGHTGTIEGANPQFKNAVIINSPAFVGGNISVLASSTTKVTKKIAHELIEKTDVDLKNKKQWNLDCLIQEISNLRSRQSTWAKNDYLSLLLYEQQLQSLDSNSRQEALYSSI